MSDTVAFRRSRGLGAIAAFLLLSCPLRARAGDQSAVLALRVNDSSRGTVGAVRRGRDVLVPVVDLQEVDIFQFAGAREAIGGRLHVSLVSLAPGIRFALEDREAVLRLTVSAAHLAGTPAAASRKSSSSVALALRVNELPKGTIDTTLRDDNVFVPVVDLQGAEIFQFVGVRRAIGGRLHVSLASLAPGIRFALDEREAILRLTVSAAHLAGMARESSATKSAPLPALPAGGRATDIATNFPALPAVSAETAFPPAETVVAERGAVFALRVNELPKGEVLARLRGDDVLVGVAELQTAGVLGFAGKREVIGEQIHVSLASLAPDVHFIVDEEEVALKLTVSPRRLGITRIDLGSEPPKGMVRSRDSSAFVNYAVRSSDFERFSGFGEVGWSVRGNLLYSGASRNEDGTFVRGLSNFTIDDPGRMRRWTLGDRFAETGALGGGAFLGGISLSRDFDLDPYFVRFPQFGLSGAVSTPSTVDVYVDGSLVRREQLPPGQFDLRNVPVSAGSGSTRLVVRDAFGNERQIASPYYFSQGVLSKGLSDYSYNLGFVRENLATQSGDYERVAFLGRHRVGLTDRITLGGRLEAARDLVSGGPTVTARLPFGEIELSAAASREKSANGAAGSVGFTHIGRLVSFGAVVRALTDRYSNTSVLAVQDRSVLSIEGSIGTQLSARVSLSAQYRSSDLRDDGRHREASLSATARLAPHSHAFFSAGRLQTEKGKWTTTFAAGLTYSLGSHTTAGLSHRRRNEETFSIAEVQRPLTRGTGLGYLVQVRDGGGRQSGFARLQYQGQFGNYEASYDRAGGQSATQLSASGGLVAIGGSLYATRAVQQSFALIRVPGVGGVRGFSSNQEVGRTSESGDLLVPDLLSYYGNRLSISDQDVPLDHSIEATEKVVAPPHRGGALVSFPVRRVQSATGSLTVLQGKSIVVPASGELTVQVGENESASPLGNGGEFYLENVPSGRHPAKVEYGGGTCRFVLEIPPSSESFLNVGPIVCEVR